ncbi:MAG TPA: DUF6491 family protein [Gammaproteobacteria bacterium]|jgi:hypothetical protein
MKRLAFGTLLALSIGSMAHAATDAIDASETATYESVRSIWTYGRLHDFDVIDRDTLILWTTPFQPYLVELMAPSHDLPFADVIAIESTSHRIYARFDSVRIAGFRYPINGIYKLSRDEARQLKQAS